MNFTDDELVILHALQGMISNAEILGINYIFIDKKTINDKIGVWLRNDGYNLIVGSGEIARIKITW